MPFVISWGRNSVSCFEILLLIDSLQGHSILCPPGNTPVSAGLNQFNKLSEPIHINVEGWKHVDVIPRNTAYDGDIRVYINGILAAGQWATPHSSPSITANGHCCWVSPMVLKPSSWAPTIKSVSIPQCFITCKIMAVMVVLPWLPPTTMRVLSRGGFVNVFGVRVYFCVSFGAKQLGIIGSGYAYQELRHRDPDVVFRGTIQSVGQQSARQSALLVIYFVVAAATVNPFQAVLVPCCALAANRNEVYLFHGAFR